MILLQQLLCLFDEVGIRNHGYFMNVFMLFESRDTVFQNCFTGKFQKLLRLFQSGSVAYSTC